MDNIIEKITLYDILGYGFPGFFFILIVIIGFYDYIPQKVIQLMKDYDGVILASAIVLSHIIGIILSEISKRISKITSFLISSEWKDINPIDKGIITKLRNSINDKAINKALVNSGYNQADESFELKEESMGYVYSVIQTDSECSRIHSYSSASVMCRNTATAALLGGVILLVRLCQNNSTLVQSSRTFSYSVMVLLIACYFLLNKRADEFRYKKYYYAMNWFILKYNGKSCQDKQNETRSDTT